MSHAPPPPPPPPPPGTPPRRQQQEWEWHEWTRDKARLVASLLARERALAMHQDPLDPPLDRQDQQQQHATPPNERPPLSEHKPGTGRAVTHTTTHIATRRSASKEQEWRRLHAATESLELELEVSSAGRVCVFIHAMDLHPSILQ